MRELCPSVLVVDDDSTTRDSFCDRLEDPGLLDREVMRMVAGIRGGSIADA